MGVGTAKGSSAGVNVSGVSFAYGHKIVFENLSFQIPQAEVWALMGASGIGKTTLLNIILGLYRPMAGTISTVSGTVRKPGQIRGAVFREGSLLGWLTVLENVLFPNHRSRDNDRTHRARELIEAAGLTAATTLYPKELSAGMYRRVELLRALTIDEKYLMADEPFTGLDVPTRLDLYATWNRLQANHKRTGLICTHDPLEAAALCDAVVVMTRSSEHRVAIEVVRVPTEYRDARRATDVAYKAPFLDELLRLVR